MPKYTTIKNDFPEIDEEHFKFNKYLLKDSENFYERVIEKARDLEEEQEKNDS